MQTKHKRPEMKAKPLSKPSSPFFGAGPCKKIPGWNSEILANRALLGRSHRSTEGVNRIQLLLEKSRQLLQIPESFAIALVPGSDTGAFEMALWNLLGPNGVEVLSWDVFGDQWVQDIQNLNIKPVRFFQFPYGSPPLVQQINFFHDVVFTWNGTTTGVQVPNGHWIPHNRQGLTFCDATSAAFATVLPWEKLDITTYSWQKVLGGEAAHGIIVLSPRAQTRLNTYTPAWAVPKILQLKYPGLFQGITINTPSLLCIEDCLLALEWVEKNGGVSGLNQRITKNFNSIEKWVEQSDWLTWGCADPSWRSQTSVCLRLQNDKSLSKIQQWQIVHQLTELMKDENVAFDIRNHSKSFPGIRIWAGPTIETNDLEQLLPWLDWGYQQIRHQQ